MWHAKILETTRFQANSVGWIGYLVPQMHRKVSYMQWNILSLLSHPPVAKMLVQILVLLFRPVQYKVALSSQHAALLCPLFLMINLLLT